jgi:DNA-binding transcriptional MocR family regulator
VVATPAIIKELTLLRQAQDICSSPLTQRALSIFIEQGWWDTHLRRVLPRYRERRDSMLRAMERHFPVGLTWTRPRGGFSCWVTLPPGVSTTDLYISAVTRGVAFTPGQAFSVTPEEQPHLRLCFSAESPERIVDAIATIGSLLRERGGSRSLPSGGLGEYVPVV